MCIKWWRDSVIYIKRVINGCKKIYIILYGYGSFVLAVKKKHMDLVPHKLTEQQFWTQFFQSHYFHLDHLYGSQSGLFADSIKHDDSGRYLN